MPDVKRDAFNAAATARSVIVRLTMQRNLALAERDEALAEAAELRRQRNQEKQDELPNL